MCTIRVVVKLRLFLALYEAIFMQQVLLIVQSRVNLKPTLNGF